MSLQFMDTFLSLSLFKNVFLCKLARSIFREMSGRGETTARAPSTEAVAQNDSGLEVYPSDFLFLRHLCAGSKVEEEVEKDGEGCRMVENPSLHSALTPSPAWAGGPLLPRCLPPSPGIILSGAPLFSLQSIWCLSGNPGHQIHA